MGPGELLRALPVQGRHAEENLMTERTRVPPASTFVIRFWREWSATGSRWRGRIEHVQSGQRADFVKVESILEFVRGLGVMAQDRIPPRQPDE